MKYDYLPRAWNLAKKPSVLALNSIFSQPEEKSCWEPEKTDVKNEEIELKVDVNELTTYQLAFASAIFILTLPADLFLGLFALPIGACLDMLVFMEEKATDRENEFWTPSWARYNYCIARAIGHQIQANIGDCEDIDGSRLGLAALVVLFLFTLPFQIAASPLALLIPAIHDFGLLLFACYENRTNESIEFSLPIPPNCCIPYSTLLSEEPDNHYASNTPK